MTAADHTCPPTMGDVLEADLLLSAHLAETPVRTYDALDRAAGARVVLKHENLQPTGAFKVRGALNVLLRSTADERARGVVAYSTGNHAQAVAHAARATGTACTIVMPERPNPAKADAVRALGARLVLHGATFDDAAAHAARISEQTGARLVGAAGDTRILAGVATAYLDLLRAAPDLDVLLVPVGGGSGAAGACTVASALAPRCEVIAVQSDASPSAYASWRSGVIERLPNTSRAEGLATGTGFPLTQQVMRAHLADFVTVTDDQIRDAQWTLLTAARTVAEGAGAAALAAVLADPGRFAGRRVGMAVTGGNASAAELREVVAAGSVLP
ncbi:threonine/serine dehydratase [Cellulomonas sp. PhB143]|uniref:threonine ammonia-lyase n=1 Tax=Cellulomonas sp. PhB143 TaxID=2485186 RepID=UPI000FB4C459|nr:pyridoxal-phosphate dependent enzyme [Cellulomonas sp. PhB143]ROS74471.1 threonine dehydratase [Cellulomonas sp. PhB143]